MGRLRSAYGSAISPKRRLSGWICTTSRLHKHGLSALTDGQLELCREAGWTSGQIRYADYGDCVLRQSLIVRKGENLEPTNAPDLVAAERQGSIAGSQ